MSEAEAFGMCMPEIDGDKLTKNDFISRGGEGEVWKGEYEGHGPVAIKIVPILGQMGKRDRTQVRFQAVGHLLYFVCCRVGYVAIVSYEAFVSFFCPVLTGFFLVSCFVQSSNLKAGGSHHVWTF